MADLFDNVARLNEAQQLLNGAVESMSHDPQSTDARCQVRQAAQLMTHAVTEIMRNAREDSNSGSHT